MAEAMQLKDVAVALGELTWKDVKLVAVHLNHMSWATLEEIENSSSLGKERVIRAIDTWKRKDVDASWAQLVSALRAEKQNAVAEKIRARYCPNVPDDTQANIDQTVSLLRESTATQHHSVTSVDAYHPFPPHSRSSISFNASTQTDKHLSPSFPVLLTSGLDQHPSTESPQSASSIPILDIQPRIMQCVDGNVAISESRIKQLEEEIFDLDDHFAALQTDTHRYMFERERKSPTFVDTFRITLLELPQRQQVQYPTLFEHRSKLRKARDVSKIFEIIRPHSNYMNYELLQLIIKRFGNSPLKIRMSKYVVKLETFEMNTTIVEFVAATNDSTEIPECYKNVIVKLKKDASKCTLHEVRLFVKKALTKKSLMMPHALMFQWASMNTVVVKLAVPHESLAHLSLAFDAEFQEIHSISQVVIDGDRLEVCNCR